MTGAGAGAVVLGGGGAVVVVVVGATNATVLVVVVFLGFAPSSAEEVVATRAIPTAKRTMSAVSSSLILVVMGWVLTLPDKKQEAPEENDFRGLAGSFLVLLGCCAKQTSC